jgi:hypothetical protein
MRRLAGVLCVLLLCTACSEPPQKEIDQAQGAIDAARAAGADRYAEESFTAATTALQQAHDAVAQRDYRTALSRAVDANERALQAAKEAADGKAAARSEAERAVTMVGAAVQRLEARIKLAETARLPARDLASSRRTLADAQRALQEARAAIASEDYLSVPAALKEVPALITAQISALDQATAARAGRGQRRRR